MLDRTGGQGLVHISPANPAHLWELKDLEDVPCICCSNLDFTAGVAWSMFQQPDVESWETAAAWNWVFGCDMGMGQYL